MTDLDRRTWAMALIVVALLCGVLPFWPVVNWLPWGSDASKWISWTSLSSGGWWEAVTNRKHFVGYRPVTAFSFVLNHATTGHAPWGYRGLDLFLHGLSGVLVALVVRQWVDVGQRSRIDAATAGIALVAMLVLFGHPATEEVVPFSARRSYLLAMDFGLLALLLFGSALRWTTSLAAWAGFVGTAALLLAAVLSNESAYVLVPMVPLVGLHLTWSAPRLRRIGQAMVPVGAATMVAVALRVSVLESLSGGYYRRYFAVVNARGQPVWRELEEWQPLRILYAAWSYLLAPHEISGARAITSEWTQMMVVAPAAAFVLGLVVWQGARRRDDPAWRSLLLAGAWLVGSTAIIVLSQTWFWRQDYWLLPPYGLALGVALREAIRRWPTDRRGSLGFGLPAIGLLVFALAHGPVLRLGMNTSAQQDKIHGSRVALAIADELRSLQRPADVALLVPLKGNRAHLARLWQRHLLPNAGHRYRLLGHLDRGIRPADAAPVARRQGDELVVSDGYWLTDGYRKDAVTDPDPAAKGSRPVQRLKLDRLRVPRRPVTVLGVAPGALRIDLGPADLSPPDSTTPGPRPARR